jgi:ATP phosphoribosyltransferase
MHNETDSYCRNKGRLEKRAESVRTWVWTVQVVGRQGTQIDYSGGGLRGLLAKAADVITYVEHGACDIESSGKIRVSKAAHKSRR